MVAQGNSTLLIAHPSSNLDAPQRPGTLQASGTHHTSALLSSMQVASLADAPHLLGPPRRGALDLSHGPLPLPTSSEASHTTFSELHKLPHALEPSSEASRTSKAGRSSLILCSNTSGDPNATTTHTTADTTAGAPGWDVAQAGAAPPESTARVEHPHVHMHAGGSRAFPLFLRLRLQ